MTLYVSGARPAAVAEIQQRKDGGWTPWWKTPYGRWRLSVEKEAMKRFPDFTCSRDPSGRLSWFGSLRSSLPGHRDYLVMVVYPAEFPDAPPIVAILRPGIPHGTPHLLEGNRPCLYRTYGGHGYDPARTTAATFVAWTALWIHAYETWLATGTWPGKGA